jgi:predicted house-cleaning noncanonical NTP pyrophosphatase (MazG superfamily)
MSNPKELRKQLRNVVQELLPEVLNNEQYEALKKHVDARVDKVEKFVKDTMHEINERHKDTMGYLVRQVTTVSNNPTKKD